MALALSWRRLVVRNSQPLWLRSIAQTVAPARHLWTSRPRRPAHKPHVETPSVPLRSTRHASDLRDPAPGWIPIKIAGQTHSFAPLVLRDLCSCPQCIDVSTRQKQFYTHDIPASIEARSVEADADGVSITWANDVPGYDESHVTKIAPGALSRLVRTGSLEVERPQLPRSYWNAATYAQETKDFEYAEYMADDKVLLHAVKQLHTHGLLFVRNVPEDEESVNRLAERIGPLRTTLYGKTWDVRAVPDAKNVAYTSQNLGFHMDLMYMQQPPRLQLLHCIQSSSSGGASLFSDSFKAVKDIAHGNPVAFSILGKQRVSYHYDHPGENYYHQKRPVIQQRPVVGRFRIWHSWPEVVRRRKQIYELHRGKQIYLDSFEGLQDLDVMDFVSSVHWSPPFQGPFRLSLHSSVGQSKVDAFEATKAYSIQVSRWHRAASAFNNLIHREDHIHERMMKPGECVIFDNTRVLHARRAFNIGDIGRQRWLKGGYIDKDPYLSRLKTLRDKFDA